VLIDGDTDSVKPGEAKIWKIEDKNVEWGCGNGGSIHRITCDEGIEYLLVVRYPGGDEMDILCKKVSR